MISKLDTERRLAFEACRADMHQSRRSIVFHKKYQYIFTIVNAFTNFIWFYPVKSTSAKEVVDKLEQEATSEITTIKICNKGKGFLFGNILQRKQLMASQRHYKESN